MRDLFVSADAKHDGGFDSTYWYGNLFLLAAKEMLAKGECAGYGKKLGCPVWENTEFWRGHLPAWFPSAVPQRFMRLLQSLDIPHVPAFPT